MEAARPAVDDDLAAIVDLARAAVAELESSRGGAVWLRREARPEPLEPGFQADLADPHTLTLVGTIDDVVVGYAVVALETLRTGEQLAVIRDLYVEPGARGVSVGEAMMDHVIEWSEHQGCMGIDGFTLPGQRETKNFFERYGLVARAIIVHRPLAGPVGSGSAPQATPDLVADVADVADGAPSRLRANQMLGRSVPVDG